MMSGRKTLEINPNHPVIVDLLAKVKADKADVKAVSTAGTLFQTALIESGYDISDPSDLANRIYKLMSSELGVNPDAEVTEVEVPEDEEEPEAEAEETEAESESDDDTKEEVEEEKEE